MKRLPAKHHKMLMETTLFIQVLRGICLTLKTLVPRAVLEAGGTGSPTRRSKIPGRCLYHRGKVAGVAVVSGYVYV